MPIGAGDPRFPRVARDPRFFVGFPQESAVAGRPLPVTQWRCHTWVEKLKWYESMRFIGVQHSPGRPSWYADLTRDRKATPSGILDRDDLHFVELGSCGRLRGWPGGRIGSLLVMATLSLRSRRDSVRGLNRRTRGAWASRRFVGLGNRATLTTALSGANNDVTLISRKPKAVGNSTRFRIVVSGASTAASVSVSGADITFNSATSAGSAATSTAAQMITMLKANAAASALVWPQRAPGNDGTGVVAALAYTNLAGAT